MPKMLPLTSDRNLTPSSCAELSPVFGLVGSCPLGHIVIVWPKRHEAHRSETKRRSILFTGCLPNLDQAGSGAGGGHEQIGVVVVGGRLPYRSIGALWLDNCPYRHSAK